MTWTQRPIKVQAVQYRLGVELPEPMIKLTEKDREPIVCAARMGDKLFLLTEGMWVVVYENNDVDIVKPETFALRFCQ